MPILARAQYDDRPSLASDLDFADDKGLTKQSDLKDCDINTIFKRFEKTGQLPDMIVRNPVYGDFSDVPSFQESLSIVRLAQEQFDALDVTVRNRFDNDPEKFLAFVNDEKNIDEMEKMGLLKPEAVAARAADRQKKADDADVVRKAQKDAERKALIAEIKAELGK